MTFVFLILAFNTFYFLRRTSLKTTYLRDGRFLLKDCLLLLLLLLLLPLDKWNVYHLTKAQFPNIVSHLRAFSHFSMSYVDVKVSQSRLNEILQNSLRVAHQLTHLELSGQPINTLNFLPNFKV